jgi:predicted alpha/beta-hydrolase family hydrolase
MKKENHTLIVNEKASVSSVWLFPERYQTALIIAHGAGNDMNSAFISYLHEKIAEQNILTIKFNFPYMEQGRKAPDRAPVLEATWEKIFSAVLEKTDLTAEQIFLSGKSMGGRYASMMAVKQNCAGVVLFGYPLHAPGKLHKLRNEHFASVRCPLLFFQGTRDSLCQLDKLQQSLKTLTPVPKLHIIEGGNHSFKTLKSLNRTEESVWQELVQTTTDWIHEI